MSIKRRSSIISAAALACGLQTAAGAGTVISGDYYEQQPPEKSCFGARYCRLDLDPIPADKILDIQQVNCFVSSSVRLFSLRMGASSTAGGPTNREMVLPFQPDTDGDSQYYYEISQNIMYRMGASRYLFLYSYLDANADSSLRCTITGKLSPR